MNTDTPKTGAQTEENQKEHIKPEVNKHKAMAVVSGSDCTYYVDSESDYINL